MLFAGDMRMNLDPLEQYKDEAVWAALEQVTVKNYAKWLVFSVSTKYEYKDEVVWGSLKPKAVTRYGQNVLCIVGKSVFASGSLFFEAEFS